MPLLDTIADDQSQLFYPEIISH